MLAQSISLALPALESELPTETQADLAALFLLSDIQLWKVANATLPEPQQAQLAHLTEQQKSRSLDEAEQITLEALMQATQASAIPGLE